MQGHPRWMGHSGEFWQIVSHWRREWQTTPVYLLWEPHELYKKENGRSILKNSYTISFKKLTIYYDLEILFIPKKWKYMCTQTTTQLFTANCNGNNQQTVIPSCQGIVLNSTKEWTNCSYIQLGWISKVLCWAAKSQPLKVTYYRIPLR